MIEIWQECASFQTTSQTLADQVRAIIKVLFSDLEILEIHQETNKQETNKQDNNTVPDTSRVVKQKQPATLPNNAQPSNPK